MDDDSADARRETNAGLRRLTFKIAVTLLRVFERS